MANAPTTFPILSSGSAGKISLFIGMGGENVDTYKFEKVWNYMRPDLVSCFTLQSSIKSERM